MKKQAIIRSFLILIIIVILNFISSLAFFRIDLTQENRYTLANSSKKTLSNLKDIIFIKVYLDGDIPLNFKKLRNEVKELLDEFKVYAGTNIEYEFINLAEKFNDKNKEAVIKELVEKGLIPIKSTEETDEGGKSEKIIFPAAIINYGNRELAVNFLKNNSFTSAEENISNTTENLEYEFISSIMNILKVMPPSVAFTQGHGELKRLQIADIAKSLGKFYRIGIFDLNEKIDALDNLDAIIIAAPDTTFSEKDKFIIDQFIMKGGKVLWLIDAVKANMDSLSNNRLTVATNQIIVLNLQDILFKYGVRINPNIVQDLQCATIPVNLSTSEAQPQYQPFPWYYFPLITPRSNHPIVKNINALKCEFPSTIDTVGEDKNIKKTYLLYSSKNAKVAFVPATIDLATAVDRPSAYLYNKQNLPIAVLLEGTFESNFKGRVPMIIEQSDYIKFQEKSKKTKMIVVADGDIAKNYTQKYGNEVYPLPLGADKYFKSIFYEGNKEFLVNCINYLLDDEGLMEIRSRELKLRLLDKRKIKEERIKWQTINVATPIFIIIILGLVMSIFRKRKWAK